MERRQLNKEEQAISRRSKSRILERNIYLDYLVEYHNLMINEGLKENLEDQLIAMNEKLISAKTEYQKKHSKLMVEKGLHLNYLEQRKKFMEDLSEIESELKLNKEKIKIIDDQLKNGVETKSTPHIA